MSDEPDSRFSVSERSASRREAGAQHEGPRQTSYLHVGLEGNVHVSASLCAASGSRLKKRQKLSVSNHARISPPPRSQMMTETGIEADDIHRYLRCKIAILLYNPEASFTAQAYRSFPCSSFHLPALWSNPPVIHPHVRKQGSHCMSYSRSGEHAIFTEALCASFPIK
ncbi:hypothetical protein IG631_15098 [Alternaria alternata]|nr:hypothetical protein IG631_15098 [Alternaria alternata]